MKAKRTITLIFITLLGLFLLSGPIMAQEDPECSCLPPGTTGEYMGKHEVLVSLEDGLIRYMTTFESGAHLAPIRDPIAGMGFAGWYTLTVGPYSNNPSKPTVAFWMQGLAATVTFAEPVASVSLAYGSRVPVKLEGFDADGNLMAVATGPVNSGNGLDTWDPLGIDIGDNYIESIRVTGRPLYSMIDDFQVAYVTNREVCTAVMGDPTIDLANDMKVTTYILSSEVLDAVMVDSSSILIGDPRSQTAAAPVCTRESDIDGDGMPDLEAVFCLGDLLEAGAIDFQTIQLLLTATVEPEAPHETPTGMEIGGLQTAAERIDRNIEKLIGKGNNGQAVESLMEVSEELYPTGEPYDIMGITSVTVVANP